MDAADCHWRKKRNIIIIEWSFHLQKKKFFDDISSNCGKHVQQRWSHLLLFHFQIFFSSLSSSFNHSYMKNNKQPCTVIRNKIYQMWLYGQTNHIYWQKLFSIIIKEKGKKSPEKLMFEIIFFYGQWWLDFRTQTHSHTHTWKNLHSEK